MDEQATSAAPSAMPCASTKTVPLLTPTAVRHAKKQQASRRKCHAVSQARMTVRRMLPWADRNAGPGTSQIYRTMRDSRCDQL